MKKGEHPRPRTLIECPKQRAATFKRRLKGLRSGCGQLSTLCGVKVLLAYCPPGGGVPELLSWPEPAASTAKIHQSDPMQQAAVTPTEFIKSGSSTDAVPASTTLEFDFDFPEHHVGFSPVPVPPREHGNNIHPSAAVGVAAETAAWTPEFHDFSDFDADVGGFLF